MQMVLCPRRGWGGRSAAGMPPSLLMIHGDEPQAVSIAEPPPNSPGHPVPSPKSVTSRNFSGRPRP